MIPVGYDLSKFIVWAVLRSYCGLEVTGQAHVPARGAFILASNHVSFLDPPLLGVACPRRAHFLARRELFKHVPLRMFMWLVGVIPLARGESDLSALRTALGMLQDGRAIGIFPEGTRQLDGALATAKAGVGFLAMTAQVPIVPVYISGAHLALPQGSQMLRRRKIRVAFGEPIPYTSAASSSKASTDPGRAGDAKGNPARQQHDALAAAVTQAWRRLEAQVNGRPLGPA